MRRVRRAWAWGWGWRVAMVIVGGSVMALATWIATTPARTLSRGTRAIATHDVSSRTRPPRSHARPPSIRAPFVLPAGGSGPRAALELVVYPPRDASVKRPVALMLHGMCGAPESTCEPIARALTRDHWLVCPRGPAACEGGGATWSMRDTPAQIEASVGRLAALESAGVDAGAPRTLLGFSFGATVAVAVAERGPWARVVLLGAEVHPDAYALRRAGVQHVVLGSGDYDMMKGQMIAASELLRRGGLASHFVSFGPVGHAFPSDIDAWIARALAWNGDEAI